MNRSRDYASALLKKAEEDHQAMALLMADASSADWIVGFHAKQAVEKAIKAVLTDEGVEYPLTHLSAARWSGPRASSGRKGSSGRVGSRPAGPLPTRLPAWHAAPPDGGQQPFGLELPTLRDLAPFSLRQAGAEGGDQAGELLVGGLEVFQAFPRLLVSAEARPRRGSTSNRGAGSCP